MSDAKYFQRGKIQELRTELNSDKKDPKYQRKKMVMKKIVANMTMGNDMSSLFNDVVSCMSINLLEIKKMVYLYLINYARAKPDLAVNATAYFLKDVNDNNPLIRALAIRTMSYIQVKKIMVDLVEPLHKSLKDSDPYVRKTAATCVAKLYMYDRNLVDEEGFITKLKDLLLDANPTVVANAVAALAEISERSPDLSLQLNLRIASKLITALNDCNEWGQAYILETLLYVVPQEPGDAEMLAERIAPRLQHANSSVVLNAIKVIIYLLNYFGKEDDVKNFCKKLSPPLVTLLSTGPEVQYVVLRNILLVIQKHPDILKDEIKVFFCKYNDPIYVKLAKLEIIFRLATASNIGQVLGELVEYASEVDVDFVRKSVRAIGRLAIKIPSSTQRCISALLDLIQTKVNYVVQEGIVVIKDIFRKYPNKYESIIGKLCENLDSLDEPEAKAAMIWIIGQYADRIDNSDEILESFMESFKEDPPEVQLSLLTAVVKLFVKRPTVGQELVPKILKWSTEEVDNPDLRDRGFIYWRLLSMDPAAAKAVVLSEKPDISTETENIEIGLLDELLLHLATLSSVYHKVPSSFIPNAKVRFLVDSKVLHSMVPSQSGSTIQPKVVKKAEAEKDKNVVIDDFFNNPYTNDVAPMQNGQIVNLLDLDSGDFASAMGHFNSTTDFGNGELAETNVTYGSNLLGQSMYGSTNSSNFYDSSRQNSQSSYMPASNIFSTEPTSYNGSNVFNSGSLVDSPFTTNNSSDFFNTANSNNVFNTSTSNYYSAQTNSSSNLNTLFSTHQQANGFSSPNLASNGVHSGVTSPVPNVFGTTGSNGSSFNQTNPQNGSSGNLLGDYITNPNSNSNLNPNVDSLVDSMNQMSIGDTYIPAKSLLLDAQSTNGIEVHCTFARRQGKKQMALQFNNRSQQTLTEFAIQFNKNTFGLNLVHGLDVSNLPPNGTTTTIVDLACQFDTFTAITTPIDQLQVAFKTNLGVAYSQTSIPLHILLVEGGLLDQDVFLNYWRELATSVPEFTFQVTGMKPITATNDLRNKLHTNNLFTVADRNVNGKTYLFMSAKLEDSTTILIELTYSLSINPTVCNCAVKIVPNSGSLAALPTLLNSFQNAIEGVLRS